MRLGDPPPILYKVSTTSKDGAGQKQEQAISVLFKRTCAPQRSFSNWQFPALHKFTPFTFAVAAVGATFFF